MQNNDNNKSDSKKPLKTFASRLLGEISYDSVATVMRDIDDANFHDHYKDVRVTLTTIGGELYPAFALFDHIRASAKPVDVVATGVCMSSGVMILQAGRARLSRPHTTFMVHPSSTSIEDSYDAFFATAEQYRRNHELLVRLITERVGLERAEFEKIWEPRKYFTAEEALKVGKHGLIDRIE